MIKKEETKRNSDPVDNENQENQLFPEEYHIQFETDEAILIKINQRKEENQALKKLLENLNTTMPKSKSKKRSNNR